MPTGRISAFLFWNALRIPRRGRSDSHLFQLLYWAVLISVILSLHTAVVFKHPVLYWNSWPSAQAALPGVLMSPWSLRSLFSSSHSEFSLQWFDWLGSLSGVVALTSVHHRVWTLCGFTFEFLQIPMKIIVGIIRGTPVNLQDSPHLPLFPFCSSGIVPPWQLEWITPTMLHTLCFQFSSTRALNY